MDERKTSIDYEALNGLLEALGEGVANRATALAPAQTVAPQTRSPRGWLRRARATAGVGLTWAAAWGLVGGLMWLGRTAADYGPDAFSIALFLGRQYAVVGLLGGVTFSVLLQATHSRRRFDELETHKFAAWGALGGLLIGAAYAGALAALFGGGFDAAIAQFLAVTTLFGGGSAAGSLAIARRAGDRRLPEPSE